jgi:RHS repeat-associated protein
VQQTVGTSVTNYLWDEASIYGDVVLETDGNGVPQASYVLGDDELLAQARSGAVSYYLEDGQGNVRLLTDGNGAVTDRYTYDAYGNLLSSQGSTVNPYRYTGQYFDSLTGLYDLRARYYDPTTGRFTSADTADVSLDNPTELNRYLYVDSNPVNAIDPTGHTLEEEAELTDQIAIQDERVVQAFGYIRDLITAADAAHILALEARLLDDLAWLIYQRLLPGLQKGLPGLKFKVPGKRKPSGVGLSLFQPPIGPTGRIAALNDIGLQNSPLLATYTAFYVILRWVVQDAGFKLVHPGDLIVTKEQASKGHEEAWLLYWLQIYNLAGEITEKTFPIIGVSQNTICGECLRNVFGVSEGNIPDTDVANEASCILDPENEITVVGAANKASVPSVVLPATLVVPSLCAVAIP